jgi:hypothetical protein
MGACRHGVGLCFSHRRFQLGGQREIPGARHDTGDLHCILRSSFWLWNWLALGVSVFVIHWFGLEKTAASPAGRLEFLIMMDGGGHA